MKEYLNFIRELADLIEEVGFDSALGRIEYRPENNDWESYYPGHCLPGYSEDYTYRIKPATTQHPGGEMPQHVSREVFDSMAQLDRYHSPFMPPRKRSSLRALYGENAHKIAFDTAEKAKAAEKVMRGF